MERWLIDEAVATGGHGVVYSFLACQWVWRTDAGFGWVSTNELQISFNDSHFGGPGVHGGVGSVVMVAAN